MRKWQLFCDIWDVFEIQVFPLLFFFYVFRFCAFLTAKETQLVWRYAGLKPFVLWGESSVFDQSDHPDYLLTCFTVETKTLPSILEETILKRGRKKKNKTFLAISSHHCCWGPWSSRGYQDLCGSSFCIHSVLPLFCCCQSLTKILQLFAPLYASTKCLCPILLSRWLASITRACVNQTLFQNAKCFNQFHLKLFLIIIKKSSF